MGGGEARVMWDGSVVAETREAPNVVAHPFDPKLVSSRPPASK